MTDLFKTSKVISALPSVIEPNTTYWVRTGLGFDLYLSDSTGSTVHKINGTPPYIPVPYNFTVNGDATLNTSISQTSDVTAAITLANSGVTAGTYGSSTEVPAIIVDLKGRVTKVTKTPIRTSSITQSGIVQLSVATNSTSVSTAATSSAVKATYDLALAAIPNSKFGTALGVATLDATGKIPSVQLPSYVDDVMEFATEFAFPNPGETGKLYVDLSSNKLFRWTGTTYVNISGGSEIADASLKLYTARSFSLIGGATSDIVNFDGTGNVTLTINGLNPDTLTKAVPIEKGGTGAITVAAARNNLGLGTAATKNVGGTTGLLELSGSKVPSVNLPEASVTQAGIVMLDDTYESDSVTTSPTSKIFKSLYNGFLSLMQDVTDFISTKSKANGLASLDDSGKLPTAQLTTHSHTPAQAGLGNVNNTSDIAKPISTLTQNALDGKANTSHTHTAADIGLGNVNNTSDINKPISTATQNALNGKANTSHTHTPAQVGLSNVNNTSDIDKPISTAVQNALNLNVNNTRNDYLKATWPDGLQSGDCNNFHVGTSYFCDTGVANQPFSYAHVTTEQGVAGSKIQRAWGYTSDITATRVAVYPNWTYSAWTYTRPPLGHNTGDPAAMIASLNNSGYKGVVGARNEATTSVSNNYATIIHANVSDTYFGISGDVWGAGVKAYAGVLGSTNFTYDLATKQDINNLVNFTHVGPTAPSTSGLAVNSVWLDTSTEA